MAKSAGATVGMPWQKAAATAAVRKASLFKNGANQAVRLPQELRFPDSVKEVTIQKEGDRLVITPVPVKGGWASYFASTVKVPDDFMADRDRTPPQARDLF